MLLNQQKLLFNESRFVHNSDSRYSIPENFYTEGYTVFDNIANVKHANSTVEKFIANIDATRIPYLESIRKQIQLAKADLIPVCDDVVHCTYQVLHFDMGQAFAEGLGSQMMITTIGLYMPFGKTKTQAITRILNLQGFLHDAKWGGPQAIEEKILNYAQKSGDGWGDINTGRLACFARVIDAVSSTSELADHRNKTMGQWFRDDERLDVDESMKQEYTFYALRGLDLGKYEKRVQLQPGQLLIIDNLRALHGRMGKRKAQEIYQLMYGVKEIGDHDISAYRKYLSSLLSSHI